MNAFSAFLSVGDKDQLLLVISTLKSELRQRSNGLRVEVAIHCCSRFISDLKAAHSVLLHKNLVPLILQLLSALSDPSSKEATICLVLDTLYNVIVAESVSDAFCFLKMTFSTN